MSSNGNGNGDGVSSLRFNATQLAQFMGLVIAGLLAWGNLKADIREGFARLEGRVTEAEHRIDALEHRQSTRGRR